MIRETYRRAARYGADIGMDLLSGKKLFGMLTRAHLEDIKTDHIVVDTCNSEREDFAQVIESWRAFSVFTIGDSLQLSKEEQRSLLDGYDAQLCTIRNPDGYAAWGMVACSGRKPESTNI